MFTFADKVVTPDPMWDYTREICESRTPLIIDNGKINSLWSLSSIVDERYDDGVPGEAKILLAYFVIQLTTFLD